MIKVEKKYKNYLFDNVRSECNAIRDWYSEYISDTEPLIITVFVGSEEYESQQTFWVRVWFDNEEHATLFRLRWLR